MEGCCVFLKGAVRAGADCSKIGGSGRGDDSPRVGLLVLERAARGPELPCASDHTRANLHPSQVSPVLSADLRRGQLCDRRWLLAHGKADE